MNSMKPNTYIMFQQLPGFKSLSEGYTDTNDTGKFYNQMNNYNTSMCHSYTAQNYKQITPDALTHGSLIPKYGHFNIMNAYGEDALTCNIGTVENFKVTKANDCKPGQKNCIRENLGTSTFNQNTQSTACKGGHYIDPITKKCS